MDDRVVWGWWGSTRWFKSNTFTRRVFVYPTHKCASVFELIVTEQFCVRCLLGELVNIFVHTRMLIDQLRCSFTLGYLLINGFVDDGRIVLIWTPYYFIIKICGIVFYSQSESPHYCDHGEENFEIFAMTSIEILFTQCKLALYSCIELIYVYTHSQTLFSVS